MCKLHPHKIKTSNSAEPNYTEIIFISSEKKRKEKKRKEQKHIVI